MIFTCACFTVLWSQDQGVLVDLFFLLNKLWHCGIRNPSWDFLELPLILVSECNAQLYYACSTNDNKDRQESIWHVFSKPQTCIHTHTHIVSAYATTLTCGCTSLQNNIYLEAFLTLPRELTPFLSSECSHWLSTLQLNAVIKKAVWGLTACKYIQSHVPRL